MPAKRRTRSPDTAIDGERGLKFRVTEDELRDIKVAAALGSTNVSRFVRRAAVDAARQVIAKTYGTSAPEK
ncbi:MAG TPA: hypothetical protein DD670_10685 [Planctomycetaceae bacterium]|nr:hypothetical protein [Planctomycetaceae bacterium]